jgi:hypothetical protein
MGVGAPLTVSATGSQGSAATDFQNCISTMQLLQRDYGAKHLCPCSDTPTLLSRDRPSERKTSIASGFIGTEIRNYPFASRPMGRLPLSIRFSACYPCWAVIGSGAAALRPFFVCQ